MFQIIIGIFAFFLCLLYDILVVKQKKLSYLLFLSGGICLIYSTASMLINSTVYNAFIQRPFLSVLCSVLALISLILLAKVLFFSFPATTYTDTTMHPTITSGWYALC